MKRILPAALAYFAVALAFGFVFGTLRVLFLAPAIGDLAAVLVEAPVMLAVSVFAAARLIPRFGVGSRASERLSMGGIAFVLLQVAEGLLAGLLGPGAFADDVAAYVEAVWSPARMIGLAAQVGFALIPLFVPSRSEHVRA